ncbi:MAG TPA: LysR family transcriptional regulator [Gammaproteobacteria bacterium]|nr:LysR family transcriptional regulator [Gammaproteobacteria bacterium]
MDRFLEMQTFAAVADAGSFVKAAEVLGLSKAAVSRHIADLETRLGVRLIHRTTRRLSLTEEGEVFLARSRELIDGIEEAEAELGARGGTARGLLRINAPVSFGISHLAPLWPEFQARYPEVRLDVELSDRIVDLLEEGYDLAIRIADLPSSTLVGRRLATTRMVLCASPEYIARHGEPREPAELAGHLKIAYSYWGGNELIFEGPEGEARARIDPHLTSNNGETCRAAALAHQGIILQPNFLIGDDLAAGRLIELMPEYHALELGIYALYPTRKHVAPKVRAMIDFLLQRFADADTV